MCKILAYPHYIFNRSMPDKALRTGRHCVFMLHAHLIFITKYRGKVLSRAMLRDMEKIMRDVCAIQDVTLAEFNG
ncbi:transposase, partial [Thiolapillus sp.]|uniref:transposase n=1 Tax=Thiolapillus sp. TaxID=2017437 RepID=UPI003AF4EF04